MWAVRPSRSRTSASQCRGATDRGSGSPASARPRLRSTGVSSVLLTSTNLSLNRRPAACPPGNGRADRGESAPWPAVPPAPACPTTSRSTSSTSTSSDEMRAVVPGVRLLGHLLPGPARRPRRPQAGAAPDPLHDERHGPAARPRARQERPRRRRGHGPAAPARRRRDLRRPGPDGAALVDAAADRRRPRQLRLARRLPGRDALHRVPDGARRRWR